MLDVGIIDYGMGNIGSIVNMLRRVGARPQAIKVPDELKETEGAILPGIGAFDNAMNKLHAGGWLPVLEQYARRDMKPMMGICLGMQLMTESS